MVLASEFHLPLPALTASSVWMGRREYLGPLACGRWEATLAPLLADGGCSAGEPGRSSVPKRWGHFKELRLGLSALAAVALPCSGIGRLCPLRHLFICGLSVLSRKATGGKPVGLLPPAKTPSPGGHDVGCR